MNELLPALGVLVIAAITPGPNNIMVLNAGMQGGLRAAGSTIAAIVLGSLCLFLLIRLGLGLVLESMPLLELLIAAGGAAYPGWLGFGLLTMEPHGERARTQDTLTPVGAALLQLMNPKGWVLISVFAAATGKAAGWPVLVLLMTAVFAICLSIWAVAGKALARFMENRQTARWVNGVMGLSLIIFSGLIIVQQVEAVTKLG